MFQAPLRMVTDFLNDAELGLNAELAKLPLEDGDFTMSLTLIADETRNASIANSQLPVVAEGTAVLAVNTQTLLGVSGQVDQEKRAFQMGILFRVGLQHVKAHKAMQAAHYIYHALTRTLQRFNDDLYVAHRTRNGIQMWDCEEMHYVPLIEPIKDAVATGGIIAVWNCRDITVLTS